MNTNQHNKKRNAMLMYEFLVRTISKAILENNLRQRDIALNILKKCFKPGTELYKEFRLANAMYKTTVSSPSTASSIIAETKNIIKKLDNEKLNKEKSILIREVNIRLNDDSFYDQPITDYRVIATIQTLFNEWKNVCHVNIEKLAEYEDIITNWLTKNKQSVSESVETDSEPGTTRIVSKLINQKFNEKYSGQLSTTQKAIVRAFALKEHDDSLKNYLNEIKENLFKKLDNNLNESKLDDKFVQVRTMLLEENLEQIDIDTVTRFMWYSQLSEELQNKGNNNVADK